MWRKLLEVAATVIRLADDLKRNQDEIKEIRQELRDLTAVVQRLKADVEYVKEREATERNNLILRVENALMRFDRHIQGRLRPPSSDEP